MRHNLFILYRLDYKSWKLAHILDFSIPFFLFSRFNFMYTRREFSFDNWIQDQEPRPAIIYAALRVPKCKSVFLGGFLLFKHKWFTKEEAQWKLNMLMSELSIVAGSIFTFPLATLTCRFNFWFELLFSNSPFPVFLFSWSEDETNPFMYSTGVIYLLRTTHNDEIVSECAYVMSECAYVSLRVCECNLKRTVHIRDAQKRTLFSNFFSSL